MAVLIDQLTDVASKLILREARVRQVRRVSEHFLRLDLDVRCGGWAPGHKVQFRIGGMSFRTYTPFDWDDRGASFLLYRHGEGPATAWADTLDTGDEVRLFGPRGSLNLSGVKTAPIVVGDETSFGLATAWALHGSVPAAAQVFEVTSVLESAKVVDELDIGGVSLLERTPGDDHHHLVTQIVLDAICRHPEAPLIITGKAQTIKAVRAALKQAGTSPTARVKAYWDPNRTALD